MCGIVGYIRNKGYQYNTEVKAILQQLLYVDALRGFDSTGIALASPNVINKEEMLSYKRAIPAQDFLNTSVFSRRILPEVGNYDVCIGHNRWATKGSVIDKNAHPFEFGDVVGVHNGTLDSISVLGHSKSGVDSENLIEALSSEDASKVLESIGGAYSIVWWDKRDGILRMARNDDRPMYVVFIQKLDLVIFGSEDKMLEWVIERNKLTVEETYDLSSGYIHEFKPEDPKDFTSIKYNMMEKKPSYGYNWSRGKWSNSYTKSEKWDKDDVILTGDSVKFDVIRVEEGKNKGKKSLYGATESATTVVAHGVDKGFNVSLGDTLEGIVQGIQYVDDIERQVFVRSVTKQKKYMGPSGEVTKKKWLDLTKDGCCICSSSFFDGDVVHWLYSDLGSEPICKDCHDRLGDDDGEEENYPVPVQTVQ
jgi:hypothetical protein